MNTRVDINTTKQNHIHVGDIGVGILTYASKEKIAYLSTFSGNRHVLYVQSLQRGLLSYVSM